MAEATVHPAAAHRVQLQFAQVAVVVDRAVTAGHQVRSVSLHQFLVVAALVVMVQQETLMPITTLVASLQ